MAGLGWLGLPFPERYGGAGFSFQDLAVLLEEMGRFLLPGPFFSTVALCGQAILDSGTEGQKAAFLTSIASGEMRMALALTEPGTLYQADGISLLADRVGGGYVLNGAKMFVSDWLGRRPLYRRCQDIPGGRPPRGHIAPLGGRQKPRQ